MALLDEDRLAETVTGIRQSVRIARDTVRTSAEQVKMLVWNNPWGLTPQQVMNALGKDAAELDGYVAPTVVCADALHEEKIGSWIPADQTIKANADGSVTVSAKEAVK